MMSTQPIAQPVALSPAPWFALQEQQFGAARDGDCLSPLGDDR